MSDTTAEKELPPIILDLGKVSRKKIRELKKEGKGALLDDIGEAIAQARAQFGPELDTGLLPVVLLYEKKPRKKKRGLANLLMV